MFAQRYVFILISLLWCANSRADELLGLAISELSVDQVPGTAGSWVELYNASEDALECKGITLVCNGVKVLELQKPTTIPAFTIVLVRFQEELKSVASRWEEDGVWYIAAPVIKHVHASEKHAQKDKKSNLPPRGPGYVALFTGAPSEENLRDYVAWGARDYVSGFLAKIGSEHQRWACRKGFWRDNFDIRVGIGATQLDEVKYFLVEGKAFLSRKPFTLDHRLAGWACVAQEKATPGRPNRWQYFGVTTQCNYFKPQESPVKVEVSLDPRLEKLVDLKAKIARIQIARDPYFSIVIFDEICGVREEIGTIFESGKSYYVRMQINYQNINTDWSKGGRVSLPGKAKK